jgi:hypothetical protein
MGNVTAEGAAMSQLHLTLTGEERQYLVDLLSAVLKDTRVEEHRTRTPLYRESIVHTETVLVDLLKKLGQPPA